MFTAAAMLEMGVNCKQLHDRMLGETAAEQVSSPFSVSMSEYVFLPYWRGAGSHDLLKPIECGQKWQCVWKRAVWFCSPSPRSFKFCQQQNTAWAACLFQRNEMREEVGQTVGWLQTQLRWSALSKAIHQHVSERYLLVECHWHFMVLYPFYFLFRKYLLSVH